MKISVQGPLERGERWQSLEYDLMEAFSRSAQDRGYRVERTARIIDPASYDMVVFMGVKNQDVLKRAEADGVPYVYFDKAYNRIKKWWRMSYCAHNPTEYLMWLDRPSYRREGQGWEPKPWQHKPEGHIVLAGSSAKYHKLHNLPDPESYWAGVVKELREYTDRKILYRPKKSYRDARPLAGTSFSEKEFIEDDLKGAYAMITHGSNACFEALMGGIPAVVLGNGITRGLSTMRVSEVNDPLTCDDESKLDLLNDLAYFQWTTKEIEQGEFWTTIDDCAKLREVIQTAS
jgi:hypothetical protein